jgi:hypothetical protein
MGFRVLFLTRTARSGAGDLGHHGFHQAAGRLELRPFGVAGGEECFAGGVHKRHLGQIKPKRGLPMLKPDVLPAGFQLSHPRPSQAPFELKRHRFRVIEDCDP